MPMSPEELTQQCFTVPTAEQYAVFVREHDLPPLKEEIPGGGSALWFGSPSAKRVMAHMHGGGLVMYASAFHFSMAYNMYKPALKHDDNVAVVMLAYDTCPTAPYPTQLRQLVALITYLIDGRDAKDIDLYGDSVGGILILALLLHIRYPHPKVPPLSIPCGQSLGRVLLMSPTAPMVTPAVAASKNIGCDIVGVDDIAQMWSTIKSNHDPEIDIINPWFTPLSMMREDWYENLPAGTFTIIFGGLEIFEEDIVKLSELLKAKHHGRVDINVDENAGHIAFLREGLMDIPPSDYTRRAIDWAIV